MAEVRAELARIFVVVLALVLDFPILDCDEEEDDDENDGVAALPCLDCESRV